MVMFNLMITAYISYTYTENHNSFLQEDFIVIINFMMTISFTGNVVLKFFRFLFLKLLILLSYYTFPFTKSRNSNLMLVIVSVKTEFAVHFSYLWNGVLINDKIPKHSKNDACNVFLNLPLICQNVNKCFWKNNGFYVETCFLHYIKSYT